jgi:hypothetical protein
MPNDPFAQTPWESIEGITQKAAKPVKQAVADVATDVKQQVMGPTIENDPGSGGQGQKPVDPAQQEQMEKQKQRQLEATRQRLAKLNEEIAQARQKRLKREEEWKKQQEETKKTEAAKQAEVKKKDNALMEMIKGKQGSHEMRRTGE